ncbi:uncharacterized protein PV09_09480 [Verruconis gallopava]|uniref:Uncharacterized protein n=1 Tax=Verruconis gallopava TaxID=253628 RepID=A0A0D2AIJ6_9PEZI|nr:uncharacterized protein PV09_09480 [Verruconis gallopava]KIV98748.1 hypothetical protein PV09_09480 [Verruconis gallopava]
MGKHEKLRSGEKEIILSMIDGQSLDERLSTQRDQYPRFNELHKNRYGVRSNRSRASFRYHYDAVIKELRGRPQFDRIREEQVVRQGPDNWQDGGLIDIWSEETDASLNNASSQSNPTPDESHQGGDTSDELSNNDALVEREDISVPPVDQPGQEPSSTGFSGIVAPNQAGIFQENMPFATGLPSVPGPIHTQTAEWYTDRPMYNVPQGSSTVYNKTMQNSQLQLVTDTQVLWVPIVRSTTYNVPTAATADPIDYPQERISATFPTSSPYPALSVPVANTMAAQHAVESPFTVNYYPHDNPFGFMPPIPRPFYTFQAAAANAMDSMTDRVFNFGSPTVGGKRNWVSHSDTPQAIQTQLPESSLGNVSCEDMIGWVQTL